jgi:hypothetical protein
MYREVEDQLKAYVDDPSNPHNLSDDEKKWFRFLIDNFRTEFNAWGGKAELEPYFQHFSRGSKPYRAMGGAYLHISYDLSRVIADSLKSNQAFSFGLAHARARGLFLLQAPIFFHLVEECGKNPRIFGLPFAWINRICGARCRFSLAGVIGNWILALRTTAWVHGEILNDSSTWDRTYLEYRILDGIISAARHVARNRTDVLAWPRRLKPSEILPTLAAYSVILLLQAGEPNQPFLKQLREQLRALWGDFLSLVSPLFSNPVSAILIAVILGAVGSSLYLAYTYVKAVAWADRLGEAILYRVEQQIIRAPTEGRQQSE